MAKSLHQKEIKNPQESGAPVSDTDDYNLAQSESSVSADAEKHVNTDNFERPRLFTQDQIRVLNRVHEAFARDLSVYLSAQIRTIVDISLTAVVEVGHSEYMMSSAPPTAIYVVQTDKMDHQIIFELDPRLVIFTIEKLFGGPGVFLRKPREVSLIEQRIMSKVMGCAFRELEKAWGQDVEITLREVAFESNIEFVQFTPGVEPALLCTFEVVIQEQRSFINMCYPHRLLERILGRMEMGRSTSGSTKVEQSVLGLNISPASFPDLGVERIGGDDSKNNHGILAEAELEITVELGRRRIPLADVLRLTTGNVIELEKVVGEPLEVYANGHLIAEGEAVVIDEQFGIRITGLVSDWQRARAFL